MNITPGSDAVGKDKEIIFKRKSFPKYVDNGNPGDVLEKAVAARTSPG